FGQQRAQHVHDAVDATERQPVGVGATDPDGGRAQRERLDNVGPAAHTRVEQHRHRIGGLDHIGQAIQAGQPAVGLPPAVIGAVNTVHANVFSATNVIAQFGGDIFHRVGRERSHEERDAGADRGPCAQYVPVAV